MGKKDKKKQAPKAALPSDETESSSQREEPIAG